MVQIVKAQSCDGVPCIANPLIIQSDLIECALNYNIEDTLNENLFTCIDDGCFEVCENSSNTYTTNYNVGSAYNWVVSGGQVISTNQIGNAITVSWLNGNSGTIMVEEVDTNGCYNFQIKCIDIKPTPSPIITTFPNTNIFCQNASIYFNAIDTNQNSLSQLSDSCMFNNLQVDSSQYYYSLNYFWGFDDGTTSTEVSPVHSYSTPGTKIVTLIISNDCQCADTTSIVIQITSDQGPQISSCIGSLCEGDTAQYCTNSISPIWSINGGSLYSSANIDSCINVIWDNNDNTLVNGTGIIIIEDLTINCGSGEAYSFIPVLPNNPEIYGDSVVCPQTFKNYSFACIPGVSYFWQVTGGIIKSGQFTSEIIVEWPNVGSCQVSLNLTSSTLSCNLSSFTFNIEVLPRISILGTTNICEGLNSIYQDLNNNVSEWNINNGTIINPTIQPFISNQIEVIWDQGAGPATIYAVPIQSSIYCEESTSINIIVNEKPQTPSGIIGDTVVCPNSTAVYIIDNSNINESLNTTYDWLMSGANILQTSGNNISILWGNSPPYAIQVQNVSDENCISDPLIQAITTPSNTLQITGPVLPCINNITSYSISSLYASNTEFTWSLQNPVFGSVISGQGTASPQIEWGNITGGTNLLLSIESCGNIYTTSYPVTIIGYNYSISTSPSILCSESIIQFTSSLFSGIYHWNFDDGSIYDSSSYSVVHEYSEPGTYQIQVTNLDTLNQCAVSQNLTIEINGIKGNISPNVSSLNFCDGDIINQNIGVVTESNTSPNNISWFLNNNLIQSSSSPDYTVIDFPPSYPNMGNYTVVLTDSLGCQNKIDSITFSTITCNNGGGISLVPIPYVLNCNPISGFCNVTFSSPNGNPVDWSNGVVSSVNTTIVYDIAGSYIVTCSQNGILIGSQTIVVPFVIDFAYNIHCDPYNFNQISVHFNDNSTYLLDTSSYIYVWDFGDGNYSTLQNPVHSYVTNGTYSVKLTISNGTYSCSKIMQVDAPSFIPVYTIAGPLCVNNPTLSFSCSNQNVFNYEWSFGDGASSNRISPKRTYTSIGVFSTTLELTDHDGCISSSSQSIWINSSPIISSIINIGPFCSNDTQFDLSNLVVFPLINGETVSWSGIGIVNAFGVYYFNPLLAGSGNHTICATITDINGCIDSKCINVNVVCPEKPKIFGENQFCADFENHQFTTQNMFSNYQWYSNSIPIGVNSPYYQFSGVNSSADLSVSFTDDNGCTSISNPFSVTVWPKPQFFTISSLSSLCPEQNITLSHNGTEANINYTWNTSPKLTTSVINIISKSNYEYYVIASSQYGCITKSNKIELHEAPNTCSILSGCYCDSSLLNQNNLILIEGVSNSWNYSTEWYINGNQQIPPYFINNLILDPNYSNIIPASFQQKIVDNFGCIYFSDNLEIETNCTLCFEETTINLSDSICDGDFYQLGSNSLYVSGNYTENLYTTTGCDSIITLELFVKPTFIYNNTYR
jgi:PKD repeat protein